MTVPFSAAKTRRHFHLINPLQSTLNPPQARRGLAVFRAPQVLLVLVLALLMLVRVSCMEVCFFASTRVMNNMRSVLVQAAARGRPES